MRHILISLILRSGIGKNTHSRLNIRKCVATLRGAFFGVFLNEARFFNFLGGFMEEEKRKLLVYRLIWLAVLATSIILTVKCYANLFGDSPDIDADGLIALGIFALVLPFVDILAFAFFIAALTFSCKTYYYKDNIIVVYAGFSHHYIKVNGKIVDEYVSSFAFTPIRLSHTLQDGSLINATVSLSNRITLKINDKLYTNGL